jgi:phage head maturation protease
MLLYNDTFKNINLVLMWEHEKIIGNVCALFEKEDGVYVEVGINDKRIKRNDLINKSFSVGFKILDSLYDKENKINLIHKINLMEVSIVNKPAQEGTHARFK